MSDVHLVRIAGSMTLDGIGNNDQDIEVNPLIDVETVCLKRDPIGITGEVLLNIVEDGKRREFPIQARSSRLMKKRMDVLLTGSPSSGKIALRVISK